jgi:hypothetical protein
MSSDRSKNDWTCVVCRRRQIKANAMLCAPCCRSYDNVVRGDSTTWAIVAWAAKRAWRFAAGSAS